MPNRKVLVISSWPPRSLAENDWNDLSPLTAATHQKYCDKRGYTYEFKISDVWDKVRSAYRNDPNQGYDAPIRTFIKFRMLLHYLSPDQCRQDWDWVVWMDADLLITNYDLPLEQFMNRYDAFDGDGPFQGDVVIPHDINGLHSTVIMVRASNLTRGLMWACANAGQTMYHIHDWTDLMALRFFCAGSPYQQLLHDSHTAKELCALHPGVYPHPEGVRQLYEWDASSLGLHLSAMDMKNRIAIAKDYVERLSLLP